MISVIIPLYNQADKLKNCLDSVLKQTFLDYEVIVVNDGSADDPKPIIEKFKNNFDSISVKFTAIDQVNKGAPAARNVGFKNSQGEYLFFCDADAILAPNCLEKLHSKLIQDPSKSYAYPSFYFGKKFFRVGEFNEVKLKTMPYIHTMGLIKREAFPGYDESLKKFQDWDLWLTLLKNGHQGLFVDDVLFKIETGGTMSSWLPSFAYKIFPWLPQVKKYNQAKKIISDKHNL